MRSLLSSMPSHPATHSTPAVSCLQHTTHGWPPPSHLSCTWEGRGRREGEGGRKGGREEGREREGGREGGRGRRGREVEGEGRKKGWESEGGREREERMDGEGAREQEGVHVGQNTRRTCGLWDTHIQEYIITSSSHITSSTHLYCIAMSHCRKRAK